MNAKRVERILQNLLDLASDEDFCEENNISKNDMPEAVDTFGDILTLDAGLVLSFPNGAEFQIAIIQSAIGEKDDNDDDDDEEGLEGWDE